MKTVEEVLHYSFSYLKKRSCENYKRASEEIVAFVLGLDRLDIYLQFERKIDSKTVEAIKKLLFKKAKGVPLEYILGKVTFFSCSINVNSSVLIPRVETEILFEHFINRVKNLDLTNKVLFDVCTGTGCLAIAAKKHFPELRVVASDISHSALKMALKNAEENKVTIQSLKGSLLSPFKNQKADFIFCNPPYLSESEYLEANNPFEPKIALLSGKTGYEHYEKLSRSLHKHLNPGGKVLFEIGSTQKEGLNKIFNQPFWVKKEFYADWAGLDRFFFLEIE